MIIQSTDTGVLIDVTETGGSQRHHTRFPVPPTFPYLQLLPGDHIYNVHIKTVMVHVLDWADLACLIVYTAYNLCSTRACIVLSLLLYG